MTSLSGFAEFICTTIQKTPARDKGKVASCQWLAVSCSDNVPIVLTSNSRRDMVRSTDNWPLTTAPCTIRAMFAEVAVPVHIRQTFTYRLPGDMAQRAHAGCRVVVPFGKKLLTGFIVALHQALA